MLPDVSEYVRAVDVVAQSSAAPANADLLDTHPASYFATASDLSNLSGTVNTLSGTVNDLGTNKLNISGGTMTGVLTAQNNTSYTTKQVRNITLSTAEPTSNDGANGDVWIVYTV